MKLIGREMSSGSGKLMNRKVIAEFGNILYALVFMFHGLMQDAIVRSI